MYNSTFTPPPPPLPPEEQKHSGIGIASFVTSILSLLLFCVGFLLSFVYGLSLGMSNPYASIDQSSPILVLATVMFCLAPVLSLVGTGLGIGTVVQKTQKKTFGIIGLVINGLILLALCVLVVIGLAA